MRHRLGKLSVIAMLSASALSCSSEKAEEPPAALPACPPDEKTAPLELRCTGLYSDWEKKTLSTEALPFKPGAELWSDGADKSRFLLIPKGTKIDTTDPDEWRFPVGTKSWKEFRVNGKRVETRLYWKIEADKWAWTTYAWSADGTKAERLDTGRPKAEGDYDIPHVETCDQCHRGRKDKLLGIDAVAAAMPESQGFTLAKAKQDGLLSSDVPARAIPEDATGKARPALAYLHMNCGVSCHSSAAHSPGVQSGLFLKLGVAELEGGKVEALELYKSSVNQKIVGNAYFEFVSKGYVRIKPGAANESLLPALAAIRDQPIQMPPIASRKPDPTGRAAMETWINALK